MPFLRQDNRRRPLLAPGMRLESLARSHSCCKPNDTPLRFMDLGLDHGETLQC